MSTVARRSRNIKRDALVIGSHQFDLEQSQSTIQQFSQSLCESKSPLISNMKCVILVALLLCSVVLALCSTDAVYEPEYPEMEEVRAVRTKRSPHFDPASIAFLSGVAAGGIFGPILYNRLYGNQGGWSAPVSVGWSSGWEAPSKGW